MVATNDSHYFDDDLRVVVGYVLDHAHCLCSSMRVHRVVVAPIDSMWMWALPRVHVHDVAVAGAVAVKSVPWPR